MEEVKFEINEMGKGAFFIPGDDKRIGEMVFSITGDKMIVDHTEVLPAWEGKGMARRLVAAMVEYARGHNLKVIPVCPYTLAVFRKDPEKYKDVWYKPKL
jgi:uncharacterized protein